MSDELDPLKDLARALGEQADLPVRKWHEDPRPGGSASVGPNDTIGSLELCWCGRPSGHDFAGKQDRAPHPRYPE